MGQITGARACLGDGLVSLVEKRVDLVGQRLDLVGERTGETICPADANIAHLAADRFQRLQSDGHLDPACDQDDHAEDDKADRQLAGKCLAGLRQLLAVDCDRQPKDGLLPVDLAQDHALSDDQHLARRAAQFVAICTAGRRRVGRQVQDAVPKRAGAQMRMAGIVDHLPIEAGQRHGESRFGQRLGQSRLPVLVNLQRRGQLVEVDIELAIEAAGHVPLEQQGQAEIRKHQRRGDRQSGRCQQAQTQRASATGHWLGRLPVRRRRWG